MRNILNIIYDEDNIILYDKKNVSILVKDPSVHELLSFISQGSIYYYKYIIPLFQKHNLTHLEYFGFSPLFAFNKTINPKNYLFNFHYWFNNSKFKNWDII